jgi:hypothetical protein
MNTQYSGWFLAANIRIRVQPAFMVIERMRNREFQSLLSNCPDYCGYEAELNADQTRFNLNLRRFRQVHPWLRENLTYRDQFDRISDGKSNIFYGMRTEPLKADLENPERVILVAHMGG